VTVSQAAERSAHATTQRYRTGLNRIGTARGRVAAWSLRQRGVFPIPPAPAERARAERPWGPKRSKFLPDLPTVAESGVPRFATGAWWGLFGPAGLPPPVVTKIRHDVLAYLQEPEAQKFFDANTMEPLEISPEDFTNLIRKDYDHWGALINALDIKLD
jgi:hypothetical protein